MSMSVRALAHEYLTLTVAYDTAAEEENAENCLGIDGEATARCDVVHDRIQELVDYLKDAPASSAAERRAKAAVALIFGLDASNGSFGVSKSLCCDILGISLDDCDDDPSTIAMEILRRKLV